MESSQERAISYCGEITEPYEPKDSPPIGFIACGVTVMNTCRIDVIMAAGQRVTVRADRGFSPLKVSHILRVDPEATPVYTVRYSAEHDRRLHHDKQ